MVGVIAIVQKTLITDFLSVSFFVTLASIVYIELLQIWGDNVTKNDTLFLSYLY